MFRVRLIDKWGAFHWADVHAQPYDGLHGSPGGYQASFRTVDAEVAATQQLERRARFDDRPVTSAACCSSMSMISRTSMTSGVIGPETTTSCRGRAGSTASSGR
jgi:hypothetical protein